VVAKGLGKTRNRERGRDGEVYFYGPPRRAGLTNSSITPAHIHWSALLFLIFLGQWRKYQTAADRNTHGRGTEERGSQGRSGCRAEQLPVRSRQSMARAGKLQNANTGVS